MAQGLVLGWLEDIAMNGGRFRQLQTQGRERIGRQLVELQESLQGLESEGVALQERVEARIQELIKCCPVHSGHRIPPGERERPVHQL